MSKQSLIKKHPAVVGIMLSTAIMLTALGYTLGREAMYKDCLANAPTLDIALEVCRVAYKP